MGDKGKMKIVNTSTACVKMTSGVPVNQELLSDSATESEDEGGGNHSQFKNNNMSPGKGNDSEVKTNNSPSANYQQNHMPKYQARVKDPQTETPCHMTLSSSQTKIKDQKVVLQNNIASKENKSLSKDFSNSGINIVPEDLHSPDRVYSQRKRFSSNDVTKQNNNKNSPVNIPKKNTNSQSDKFSKPPSYTSSDNSPEMAAVEPSINRTEQNQHPRLSQSLDNKEINSLKRKGARLVTSASLHTISDVKNKGKKSPARVNPFNHDMHVDEDHFSDKMDNYFRAERHSSGSTKSSSASQGGEWWQEANKADVLAEFGLSEDHFSHPQGHFGLSGAEELELAIDNCKEMIRDAPQDSDRQKNLVLKLVQLRIKLHEIKEEPEPVPENVKVILSHKMMLKTSRTNRYYCERCNGGIWGMLQVWYKCTECGYRCHEKCLQQILRTCAKVKTIDNPNLIMDLCPMDPSGLASQNYRCGECRLAISFKPGQSEPRLCDYSGRYYCEYCHWNDTYVIPARVLHNWDFTPQKVCRASKQFLKLMQRKAVIRIQDVNPMLFVYVDQLNEIKKLREEMMIMKKYILSCANAMAAKILLLLENRQHFVENSDVYSMKDLSDAEDILLPELVSVHSAWAQHIKVECEVCQGRGFCCELCGDREVLFPFDNIAVVCPKCSNVLHRHCFAKKNVCPRCERREKRRTENT